jgi:hypothetical protein
MKRLLPILMLPALALAIYDLRLDTLGNWGCYFTNYGTWGYGVSRAGGEWPVGSGDVYIYGAGLWVGAINGPDTLVTVGYNPNSGKSEMFPTLCANWREGSGNPEDRIYSYPGDWPPPQGRFPMAPDTARSPQELWACCCDSDPAQHAVPGRPLGLDVLLTVLAFPTDSIYNDMFFLHWELANPRTETLKAVYAGLVIDADVGNAADDRTGLILNRRFNVGGDTFTVRSTGFCWSQDNSPSGAVAARLLKGPRADTLSAFKVFILSNDPKNDFSQYLALSGHDWDPPYPYNPFDSIDPVPEDKRFLLSTGPFDILPLSTDTLVFAVIGTPFDPDDTSELALRAEWARKRWDRLLSVAEQPPTARTVQPIATIVRSVLFLPVSSFTLHSSLFSLSGQKVMSLRPGPNDVSRLSPGVYFVRSEPSAVSGEPSAVAKVVISR